MSPDSTQRDQRAHAAGHDSWAAWTEKVEAQVGYSVCGQPTVKRPVHPCSRPQAWGVENTDEGPCTDHKKAAGVKRQAIKNRFLEFVRGGNFTLAGAAKVAGVDRKTLDRWAETDEEFAEARRRAEVRRARRRLENLSDALYQDALEGKTKGNERIFLMKVLAASVRRRGEKPVLDWDQPNRVKLSGGVKIGKSPREKLEQKLTAVRERLGLREDDEEPRVNGSG